MSVALRPAVPTTLGRPVNSSAISRPPVRGNIDQIAIPQTAQTSNISPTTYVREFNVPGQNVTVEVPYRMPADVGDPLYRPLAGDPLGQPSTRSGRPVRSAGLDGGPINAGSAPPPPSSARAPQAVNNAVPGPRSRGANPGRPINPRTAAGISAAAGVATAGITTGVATAISGGGLFESIGAGIGAGIGAHYGGIGGTIAGTAAGGKVGAVTIPGVGAFPGGVVGGVVGGAAGATAGGIAGAQAGGALGRAIDDAIPDFPLPWPFNGRDEPEIPNQTDPDAPLPGPQTAPGAPAQTQGGRAIPYRVSYQVAIIGSYSDGRADTFEGQISPVFLGIRTGPLSVSQASGGNLRYIYLNHASGRDVIATWNYLSSVTQTITLTKEGSATISAQAVDGSIDPTGPATPPTYAPNPARNRPRPTTPGLPAGALPQPPQPDYPTPDKGDPWPQAQPARPPDTAPIAPAPAPAPNFSPTPSSAASGQPAPNRTPAPAGRPDPDPNAPPRPAPDLATDPDTPARGAGLGAAAKTSGAQLPRSYELPDGTIITDNEDGSRTISSPTDSPWLDQLHNPTRPLVPPVLPVPVPVGQTQPVNTPSSRNLSSNPAQNPNVQQVQPPVRQTPTEAPKGSCFYEFQRVANIERNAVDTNQRAQNPVSGFPGLYGIGIESRVKLGETFTLMQSVNEFMRKAWRATRMDKVLNLLTFIGVMHNVSMLSRDVGETFFQLISQALQAVGIRDEEDNVIDVGQVVGNTVENFLKGILGEATYNGINEAWNKANRIISSASAIIWTVRSIADSSLDLMEWIGENTGRIGNALKRWGVVGERSYPWMSESARAQGRWRSRFSKVTDALENAEDRISVYTQATSLVIEIQDEVQEGRENWQRLRESVEDGIPDPWLDNSPVQEANTALKETINNVPDVLPSEAQKG